MNEVDPVFPPIDFLAVGHVCHDLVPGGFVVGGAAAYSSSAARALTCRSGIVTSTGPTFDGETELAGIPTHTVAAPVTTVFENIYTSTGRKQTIHAVAGALGAGDIPAEWTRAPIVFIGPIANEVDPSLVALFSNSIVGVGPQGWMRRWDEHGRIFQVDWESAFEVLPLAAVTFLSTEDLAYPEMVNEYARLARLLVVTEGENGCKVYCHGEVRAFPAPRVQLIDATGAGDIFATAYLIRYHQTDGNMWNSAEFANRIAACSVTQHGLPAKNEAIRHLLNEEFHRSSSGWKKT